MSFSVGIVGLPNVGKSTLFKALTKKEVDIAAHPFTTIHPNVGIVTVPDERLEKIAEVIKPEKITPTIIEFVDIAGLVKGAHRGEGLGNQFLAHIRNCDAIMEIVRDFQSSQVEHVEGNIDPERDIETIKVELLMKDLETLENLLAKLEKDAKKGDKKVVRKFEIFKKVKEAVSRGKPIADLNLTDEEKAELKEFQLLTEKPTIYVLNIGNEQATRENLKAISFNLKMEEEISDLSESEIKELGLKSQLDQLILSCYNVLDLITFYTIKGGEETRAWTIRKGGRAPEAGGKVHSDFEEKFIRAEVIPWQKLAEASSWPKARELGWIKTVGRDYIVEDGDVIEFKI